MSLSDISLHPDGRLTRWVRQWPAKTLAREFDAQTRTVNGWRQGQWPAGPHFKRMAAHWGWPFLAYVFAPPSDAALEAQALMIARLQSELSTLCQGAAHDAAAPVSADLQNVQLGGGAGDFGRSCASGSGVAAPRGDVAGAGRTVMP